MSVHSLDLLIPSHFCETVSCLLHVNARPLSIVLLGWFYYLFRLGCSPLTRAFTEAATSEREEMSSSIFHFIKSAPRCYTEGRDSRRIFRALVSWPNKEEICFQFSHLVRSWKWRLDTGVDFSGNFSMGIVRNLQTSKYFSSTKTARRKRENGRGRKFEGQLIPRRMKKLRGGWK